MLRFRVLGFRVLGFRVLGFSVLGLRVSGNEMEQNMEKGTEVAVIPTRWGIGWEKKRNLK